MRPNRTEVRTVPRALRVMGLAEIPGFGRYHEPVDRARWNLREVARRLSLQMLATLAQSVGVIIA